MKITRLFSIVAFTLVCIPSLIAQANPGTILALEFQKPKPGTAAQYEDGRKQKAAWHKQQNDSQPLWVWETLSGDDTGVYIVGRPPQHWADFDKPSIPEAADIAEFNKVVGSNVESLVTRYYEYMPKMSNPPSGNTPTKYAEVIVFHLKYGKEADFRSAISRVTEAAQKTKWQNHFEWYELYNGGSGGEWVLLLPHDNWAGFAEQPNVKPVREMVSEAFGPVESEAVFNRFNDIIAGETSSIIQFRDDLSYLPGK